MVEIIAITRSLLNVHAFMHVFVLLYLVKVPVITGIAVLLAPGILVTPECILSTTNRV